MSDATLKVGVVAIVDTLHVTTAWTHDFMGSSAPVWLNYSVTILLAVLTWHILPAGCKIIIQAAHAAIVTHDYLNRSVRRAASVLAETLAIFFERIAKYLRAPDDAEISSQIVERANKIVESRASTNERKVSGDEDVINRVEERQD